MIIVNATAFWCDPHRPNRLSEKYQCDLGLLDSGTVKRLKAAGVQVNFDTKNDENSSDYKGFWIRPKSDGPVPVKDSSGKELPPTLMIGNGSKVKAGVNAKSWINSKSGKSGVKLEWLGLRVVDFVAYDPNARAKEEADAALDAAMEGEEGFVFGDSGGAVGELPDTTEEEEAAENEELKALFDD